MNRHQCRALMFSCVCVVCVRVCSAVWEAFTGQPAFRHLHYGEQPGHRGTPHTENPCVENSERPASTPSCFHRFWAVCLACLSP